MITLGIARARMLGALLLLCAFAGAARAEAPTVTLLGISGHGDGDSVLAKVASASLLASLNGRFPLVPAERYQRVAAALDAPSPSPADVAKVCAALKVGYLVAGLVEEKDGARGVTVTVRRGTDGQVVGRFHYTLVGADLDDDTALLMDGQILDGISADSGGLSGAGSVAWSARTPVSPPSMAPASAPTLAPALTLARPVAPAPMSAPVVRFAAASQSVAAHAQPPSSAPVVVASASAPIVPSSAPIATKPPVRPEDENPLAGLSRDGSPEAALDGSAFAEGEVAPPPSPRESWEGTTLGARSTALPLATADAGLSLVTRSFAFANPTEQRFLGPLAPALHADLAAFPLVLSRETARKPLLAALGIEASLDLGSVYGTPVGVGSSAQSLATSQNRFRVGACDSLVLETLGRPLSLQAGLAFGRSWFDITQIPSIQIPSVALSSLQASLGASFPVLRLLQVFARGTLVLPVAVSVDEAKYGTAVAGAGLEGVAGVALTPMPWLSVAAALDASYQGFTFATSGAATELYLAGTLSAGVLY